MTHDEQRALEIARCAFSAICDTAVQCKLAELTGTAVTDDLRTASQALLHLIAVIERKT